MFEWKLVRNDSVINVIPLDDWIEHTEGIMCLCEPVLKMVGCGKLVIHNALDQREKQEVKQSDV